MTVREPSLTLGIEEEYLLIDPRTGDLAKDVPPDLPERCADRCKGLVAPEFLQAQIEVGTVVCRNIPEARANLTELRGTVIEVAAEHDLALMAASTHPFAHWQAQRHTAKERYDLIDRNLQALARRLLICGMHVHIGVEDEDLRMDLARQMTYTLPHLLALSCSSPFWEGEDTGLHCFRLSVFDGLPRSGLPEYFASWSEYQRHLKVMQDAGLIEDGSFIWWDLRASARYPTLETRICDVCTLLDDALSIAAIAQSLLGMFDRLRRRNQRWRVYSQLLIAENRWRAMRYGTSEGLVDFGRGEIVPFTDLLDELIELVAEDADRLGCTAEVAGAREILARGTSADRQVATFRAALDAGVEKDEALRQVVRQLVEETARGTGVTPLAID
jgi:glutamate---cysteine ligase / carboxylate-amine ligase